MKAYSIKKIINKNVTIIFVSGVIPSKNHHSPIFINVFKKCKLFLINKSFTMKQRDTEFQRHREHHPRTGFGLFLIALGLALLVATNDMLHLGSVKDYFTWETAMIFVGVLLIMNLSFVPGIFLIAGGVWFLYDNHLGEMPEIVRTFYWPAVIILVGISLIIASFLKRRKINN